MLDLSGTTARSILTVDAPAGQPQRNILETHQQSGVPDKQILLGTAQLPPGSAIGFHTHPGDEIGEDDHLTHALHRNRRGVTACESIRRRYVRQQTDDSTSRC